MAGKQCTRAQSRHAIRGSTRHTRVETSRGGRPRWRSRVRVHYAAAAAASSPADSAILSGTEVTDSRSASGLDAVLSRAASGLAAAAGFAALEVRDSRMALARASAELFPPMAPSTAISIGGCDGSGGEGGGDWRGEEQVGGRGGVRSRVISRLLLGDLTCVWSLVILRVVRA